MLTGVIQLRRVLERRADMIIPFKPFDTLDKSLYKAEWGDKLNPFEIEFGADRRH